MCSTLVRINSRRYGTVVNYSTPKRGEEVTETKTIDSRLVVQIVRRYVAHNSIEPSELPGLITGVHRSLAILGTPSGSPALEPAIAINRSYGRDFVICLECGWRGQVLRSHLTSAHGISRADYRARWNLKHTHPLVAPAYSDRRSAFTKQLRLGQGRRAPTAASDPPAAAPNPEPPKPEPEPPKRRGRPRRTAPSAATP